MCVVSYFWLCCWIPLKKVKLFGFTRLNKEKNWRLHELRVGGQLLSGIYYSRFWKKKQVEFWCMYFYWRTEMLLWSVSCIFIHLHVIWERERLLGWNWNPTYEDLVTWETEMAAIATVEQRPYCVSVCRKGHRSSASPANANWNRVCEWDKEVG